MAAANYGVSRLQERSLRTGELRRALTALLSVLGQLDTQLRSEPESKRTVRVVNTQMKRHFPQVDYVTGQLHRRIFEPHLDGLMQRFHDAMAATLLVAPAELLPALQAMAESLEGAESPSDEWWAQVARARQTLVVASRRALGYKVPNDGPVTGG